MSFDYYRINLSAKVIIQLRKDAAELQIWANNLGPLCIDVIREDLMRLRNIIDLALKNSDEKTTP